MPNPPQYEVVPEDQSQFITRHDQSLSNSSSRNPLAPPFPSPSPADHRHPMIFLNPVQSFAGAHSRSFARHRIGWPLHRSHAHPTNRGPYTAPGPSRFRFPSLRHNHFQSFGPITNPIHTSHGWRPQSARSKGWSTHPSWGTGLPLAIHQRPASAYLFQPPRQHPVET